MTKQRIDVFISSTSIDLPEYRRAVSDAILALGLFPSGMETWAVRDENSIQLCKRKIDDAEIYLGIYAYRYGWTPEGYGGKSITELEYDWAGERNIPRLRFIMADSHPWPETEKETGAQEALNLFKKRLKQEIVGFFTTPDDLKAQVIAALAGYAQQANTTLLTPYLRALHQYSLQSGLLRALDPRTNDPNYGGRGVTVDQVYVPLNTEAEMYYYISENKLLTSKEWFTLDDDAAADTIRLPLTAMKAADFSRKLVILGDPGSGKSTFVNFLVLCLTGIVLDPQADWSARLEAQAWTQGAYLPVLVILRDFAQNIDLSATPSASSLWNFIERDLASKNAPDAALVLKSLWERGKLLLLLDGLDEVPQERRAFVRDAIERFVETSHPGNRFIITCRILSYADPAYQIAGFEPETLAPLNNEQITTFIQTWYTALIALNTMDQITAEQRVSDLGEALAVQGLMALAANPMLLTVMALVHNHWGTLPRETARLYSQCVELLLLKWKPLDARALIDLLEIREDDLLRLVWEIAFDAHDQQAERAGTADIEQHVIEQIARNRLNNDAAKAQAFCDYIERRAGLLIGRGYNRYGGRIYTFPHRTFQEFLAGCHISVNRFTRRAPELARRGVGWRETILLATGNLVFNNRNVDTPVDAVSAMLTSAVRHAEDADWRLYPLAGEMLLLVGLDNLQQDDIGSKVLVDTRDGLAQLVSAGHLPPIERAAAGRILSVLGDTRPGVGLRPDGVPDIVWCPVPAGDFIMGSDDGDNNEKPRRTVRIERAYQIAKYPITYRQFQAFIESDEYDHPEWWRDLAADENDKKVREQAFKFWNHPSETANWVQAAAFCRWLSVELGYEVRLPTEFEWERAARGTNGLIYPYGDKFDATKGNTDETGIGQTSAVGIFPGGASPVGALDMSGNTCEFCLSDYDAPPPGALREMIEISMSRGGAWYFNEDYARAASRLRNSPYEGGHGVGFRVVRFA